MAVSQLLTIFATPVVYLLLDRMGRTFARHQKDAQPAGKSDATGCVSQ